MNDTSKPEDYVVRGITALQAGRKAEARQLLEAAIRQDSRNEKAWLWLSGAVDTDRERQTCLENVLRINPANDAARQGLAAMLTAGKLTLQPVQQVQTSQAQPSVTKQSSRPEPVTGQILALLGLLCGAVGVCYAALPLGIIAIFLGALALVVGSKWGAVPIVFGVIDILLWLSLWSSLLR